MMPRADWLSAADLCSIPQARSLRAELNAQSALLPVIPDTAGRRFSPHTLTRSHAYTYTLSCVRTLSARTTGSCNFPTSPERAKQADRTTKQCVPTALCATTGYYFCAHLGGNGGGVSLHAITMDCLFLLLWTLPIPLVGCTSVKLLSTLLSWSIFKACCTYIRKIYTCALLNSAHARVVWEKNKQTSSCLLSAGLNQRQTCLITFIAVKSDPKLISSATHVSVEELEIPFWLPVFCCL